MSELLAHAARINNLPLDVLSLIFTVAVDASLYARSINDQSYGSIEYPTLLASVCACWRRAMISIPSAWSHVDLTRNSNSLWNLEHSKLYFERSRDSPLHVHFGRSTEVEQRLRPLILHIPEDVQSLLRANVSRLRSSTLNFSWFGVVTDALSILLPQGTERPLQRLAFQFDSLGLMLDSFRYSEGEWDQLLKPLTALYLQRIPLSLGYITCRNLVELQISVPPSESTDSVSFTTVQIGRILSSNPNLRFVKFTGHRFHTPPSIGTQHIHLPALCQLYLGSVHETFLNWLLMSLVPGSCELELCLEFSGRPHNESLAVDAVVSFLQRAPVSYLHISAGSWIPLFPTLTYLPHLEYLSLHLYSAKLDAPDELVDSGQVSPKLRTVDLDTCMLGYGSILGPGPRALLTLPSLQQIRYWDCGAPFVQESEERSRQLLLNQGVTAQVAEDACTHFNTRPSPFR